MIQSRVTLHYHVFTVHPIIAHHHITLLVVLPVCCYLNCKIINNGTVKFWPLDYLGLYFVHMTFAVLLIICTIITGRAVHYINNARPLGSVLFVHNARP